ncbi:MAG: phosphoribosylformylglycinamidine synthase subunit PurQ [Crocinitomicaceae bacterium]|tara:strand:- start:8982 stop:9668 length:687 start_codon:yes stop_codon:yes gene_type:complete
MKFGVITFPGSNCDQDMIYILETVLKQEVVSLWHKERDLKGVDMVVLPGGFSFGDYLRSGAIAKFSPIMNEVIVHAQKGGYVLGICNGFQMLTETGLLDGALLHNNNQKFICKNVHLKPISTSAAITKGLDQSLAYSVPIAHGEGRYYAPDDTISQLEQNDQILFKYCDPNGLDTMENNPNGSLLNIAGVTNASKNVFGMMPHPERSSDPILNNSDGAMLFESLLKYC